MNLKLKHIGLLFFLVLCFACNTSKEKKLTIATAANMQFAMEDICKEFTNQTGIKCQLVVSSSGKLTAQILAGAPFDIFASADLKYPYELFHKGLTTSEPKIYATGKLVLWTAIDSITPTLELLEKDYIEHIALANPQTAPYGKSALEALAHHSETVKKKLVYGESIAQVNQFISTKSVEVGFTSISIVTAKKTGNYTAVPVSLYSEINQGIVILKNAQKEKAKYFYDFIRSPKGKKILADYGCE